MDNELKKILIVDDCKDDRNIAKKVLEKKGFKVFEAERWIEALELIGKGIIDLVLLDISMPDMDGIELLGIIRKDRTSLSLPVIIYSSLDVEDLRCRKDINGVIEKYGNPNDLVSKVNEVLALKDLAA